jgi:hypothetical protein
MDEEIERLNVAVDTFAAAMKAKLAEKVYEGFSGWDSPQSVPAIRHLLEVHVQRGIGQEVDIANLAMMLWWHAQQPPASGHGR